MTIAKPKDNILILDTQPARLQAYERMLIPLGQNLITARSAEEALEALLNADVAVVLMDLYPRAAAGFELAQTIHRRLRFHNTPILFISETNLTEMDRLEGFELGAIDYVLAPVVPEALRVKISILANRKRMHDTLQERADLLDLASDAIMVRDSEGQVQFWNAGAEALYGWKRHEVVGKDMHQVLQTKFPVPFADIQQTLARTCRWEGNLVQRTRAGREVTVACRKALKLGLAAGRGTILEVNRDITNELQAQEALQRAEKWAAMGQVAGMIAHEINNPLEAITNAIFLLLGDPSLDKDARRYVQIVEEQTSRMSRITRQTLGFYRESREAALISIPALLDEILDFQSHDLRANGIQVDNRYNRNGKILGFPDELKQVFLNLILNAMHAMPNGGRLRVRVDGGEAAGQLRGLRVSICDTGVGIRREHVKKVFEPFFSTKSAKGTGLGLWISKGIVQKHGGTMRFRSLRLPNGYRTCFSVFLPGSVAEAEESLKQASGAQHLSRLRDSA